MAACACAKQSSKTIGVVRRVVQPFRAANYAAHDRSLLGRLRCYSRPILMIDALPSMEKQIKEVAAKVGNARCAPCPSRVPPHRYFLWTPSLRSTVRRFWVSR